MILRPYQEHAVDEAAKALSEKRETVVVAPTGAGKSVMMSALARKLEPSKALILQHRDELVFQNRDKFARINPDYEPSLFNAEIKSWQGRAVFAMVQTLSRHIHTIPEIDLLIIDEAHHAPADTYVRIFNQIRKINPSCKIAGFTATPNRGDKKGLHPVFTNCCIQITIKQMIDLGFLVPIRAFVVDVGVQEDLSKVKKLIHDFDMDEVEGIMNKEVINREVVRHWKEKCENRSTIVFCSTVSHACAVSEAFRKADVPAKMLTGETSKSERQTILHQLESGDLKVVVNVAVLTEGFDSPIVSCILLLRPCSHKSTMTQMIGRGLRIFPEKGKRDCIVLDFGTSLIMHQDIETDIRLEPKEKREGVAPYKICPGCNMEVPLSVKTCPFCDFEFEGEENETLEEVVLTEVDLMNQSPFRWVDLFGTGKVLIASGFNTFSIVASMDNETWHALGKPKNSRSLKELGSADRRQAVALADDFLREHETSDSAKKSRRWLKDPATEKQIACLNRAGYEIRTDLMGHSGFTKLTATAHLNFQWNRYQIEKAIGVQ